MSAEPVFIADPFVPPFIEHGAVRLRTSPERLVKRSMEIDQISVEFQHEDPEAYPLGGTVPGRPTMKIVDRERTVSGPNFLFRLQLEGIENPDLTYIETGYEENAPEEGWDEINRTVFTRDPEHAWFLKGAKIYNALTGLVETGYENLWVMDRRKRKHRAPGYWEVDMVLKGLLAAKPFKRRINSTPQTISPGPYDGTVTASYQIWVGFPPVAGTTASFTRTNPTIDYDIPQVSVTDTFVTSTPPPTDIFPGFWAPENPPPVFYMPFFSASVTYHIPFGWKIMNMVAEQLAGQELWILSLTFGQQNLQTPKN